MRHPGRRHPDAAIAYFFHDGDEPVSTLSSPCKVWPERTHNLLAGSFILAQRHHINGICPEYHHDQFMIGNLLFGSLNGARRFSGSRHVLWYSIYCSVPRPTLAVQTNETFAGRIHIRTDSTVSKA